MLLLSDRPTVQWWLNLVSFLPHLHQSRLTGLWQEALRDKDKGTKDKKWLSWLKGPQSEPTMLCGQMSKGLLWILTQQLEKWSKRDQKLTLDYFKQRKPWNNREKKAPQGTKKVIKNFKYYTGLLQWDHSKLKWTLVPIVAHNQFDRQRRQLTVPNELEEKHEWQNIYFTYIQEDKPYVPALHMHRQTANEKMN